MCGVDCRWAVDGVKGRLHDWESQLSGYLVDNPLICEKIKIQNGEQSTSLYNIIYPTW